MSGRAKNDNERNGATEAELLDRSRSLALDGVVEMLAQIHRAKQAREDVRERGARGGNGESGDRLPRVEVERGETAGDFLFDLARTQLDIIEKLLRFQRKHADYLVERMRPATSVSQADGPDASLLIVRGRVVKEGDKLQFVASPKAKFVVENRSAKNATIQLRLSELRSRDGAPPFHAREVEFSEKEQFSLSSDQEREVELVKVVSPHFKPGCRYRGQIEITSAGRPMRRLPLRIDVGSD